jgi:twitching motility two-component system response regulator PilG
MMEVRLVKKGYAVDFATTGEEALTKAREHADDLIFLDVMLPGIDGFDVSRVLKRNIRVQAPVVMLTGKTSRIDKLRGTLASADAYLTKPLSIDHLNQTLQRYLH